jgi:transcription elongation GreA/GreB family factor
VARVRFVLSAPDTTPLPTTTDALEAARQRLELLRATTRTDCGEAPTLDARIDHLEDFLTRAVPSTDRSGIAVGSLVTVCDLDSGAVATYEITPPCTPLTAHTVSAASPLGTQLVGRRAGEVVLIETPAGQTRRLRIMVIAK